MISSLDLAIALLVVLVCDVLLAAGLYLRWPEAEYLYWKDSRLSWLLLDLARIPKTERNCLLFIKTNYVLGTGAATLAGVLVMLRIL